jgi:murein DD-endopeptidase MepM/ murein hydrolase activator NlpD
MKRSKLFKIYILKYFILFLGLCLILFNFNFVFNAQGETTTEPEMELQVPILNYTKTISFAEYTKAIFQAALFILVIIVIVMIIWGGIKWILAGGDMYKIKEAKKNITRAIVGLIIGILSYPLLSYAGITQLSLPGFEKIEAGPDEYMEIIDFKAGTATALNTNVLTAISPQEKGIAGGQCFPVAANSFKFISWNWGGPRNGGARCHAGIDIYTKSPGHVLAIADGTVTSVGHFYSCVSGWSGPGQVDRIFVNHGSFSVNYGEIDAGKIAPGIKAGVKVKAGQFLGEAGHCGMLHFELYQGNASTNARWYPQGGSVGSGNYCRNHYLATKPSNLLDPTNTIKSLQGKTCSQ